MNAPYELGLHQVGLHQAGQGLYTYLQPHGSWGMTNAGLVVSGDEALLIDTFWTNRQTLGMLDAIAKALPHVTIKTVVNTHGDGDHWYGNALVGAGSIISTEHAATEMHETGAALLGLLSSPPQKLPPEMSRFVRRFSGLDFSEVALTYPNRTFSGNLVLSVGGRELHLIQTGPAHTHGDLIVYVPDQKLLFAGDMLFIGGHPLVHSGPIENWIEELTRILAMDVETIVPGHGPVTDKAGVVRFRGLLERLVDGATRGYRAGKDVMEASLEIDLSGFQDLLDADRVVFNVGAVYRNLGGSGEPTELELYGRLAEFADRAGIVIPK